LLLKNEKGKRSVTPLEKRKVGEEGEFPTKKLDRTENQSGQLLTRPLHLPRRKQRE